MSLKSAKAKGVALESAIVTFLRENGIDDAARVAKHGARDEGDVGFSHPIWGKTVVEAKNCGTYNISEWLRELDVEIDNSSSDSGFLIMKPRGVGFTKMDSFWVIQRLDQWSRML